jgi:hypothetical protein
MASRSEVSNAASGTARLSVVRTRGSVRFDAYYKAQWYDPITLAWRDIQKACPTPDTARALFTNQHNTWRIMEITPQGRRPLPD